MIRDSHYYNRGSASSWTFCRAGQFSNHPKPSAASCLTNFLQSRLFHTLTLMWAQTLTKLFLPPAGPCPALEVVTVQGIEQGTACACTLLSVLSGVLISSGPLQRSVWWPKGRGWWPPAPHSGAVQEGAEGVILQGQDYDKFGILRIPVLKSWPLLHQE